MILVKNVEQYDSNYIYFSFPIKNNIVANGNFIKLFYSTPNFTLNGIYLKMDLNALGVERQMNKNILFFNVMNNITLIEQIKQIEENILNKVGISGKMTRNLLYKQLLQGKIKIVKQYNAGYLNTNSNLNIVLKISGVWEDEMEYGLNYKFIYA